MNLALILPAFTAGLLTFLAPCTLPLVPGYLGFISGISLNDLKDPLTSARAKAALLVHAILYVLGFSLVFIFFGTAFGFLGTTVLGFYRPYLVKVGGIFVVLFGLLMVHTSLLFSESRWPALRIFRIPTPSWLTNNYHVSVAQWLTPGKPLSSFLFGAAFAVGWTPCVGPILGAILTLAATHVGVGEAAVLLGIFSLGMGIPFIIITVGFGYFSQRLARLTTLLPVISFLGGLFIILLGLMLFFNRLGIWISLFFNWLSFIGYERIVDYL